MSQDVLNNQEVYDLSQTGDEVQSILNKSEQLPTNPELQEALDAKQDVIPDLDSIRHHLEIVPEEDSISTENGEGMGTSPRQTI